VIQEKFMADERYATTIRLSLAQRDAIKEASRNEQKSVNKYIEDVIEACLTDKARSRVADRPLSIQDVRQILTDRIAAYLVKSNDWIADALLDIQLYREAESTFGERIHHFEAEKKHLAEKFVPLLIKRILRILKSGTKVFLVIDSGTTTYWVFRQLEKELIRVGQEEDPTLRGLVIISNNMAGVHSYMAFSNLKKTFVPKEESQKTTLSDFVACKVLTGRVLTDYAALTGDDTESALAEQRSDNQDAVFMGVVVGNWIQLPKGPSPHPVPLARDHQLHRHLEFKAKVIEVCNEVYVLSPLGKLFVNCSLVQINEGLQMSGRHAAAYRGVPVAAEKQNALKLVSTTRPSRTNVLFAHSSRVETLFPKENEELFRSFEEETDIEAVPSVLFEFDQLSALPADEQRKIEFPHEYTRQEGFMREFFRAC
jgi:hypothetical protein